MRSHLVRRPRRLVHHSSPIRAKGQKSRANQIVVRPARMGAARSRFRRLGDRPRRLCSDWIPAGT